MCKVGLSHSCFNPGERRQPRKKNLPPQGSPVGTSRELLLLRATLGCSLLYSKHPALHFLLAPHFFIRTEAFA